jgi:hypothetical protein
MSPPSWWATEGATQHAQTTLHVTVSSFDGLRGAAIVWRVGGACFAGGAAAAAVQASRGVGVMAVDLLYRDATTPGTRLLRLGSTETRSVPFRPATNAQAFERMTLGLIEQGALCRPGEPVPAPSLQAPSLLQLAALKVGLVAKRVVHKLQRAAGLRPRADDDQWTLGLHQGHALAALDAVKVAWQEPPAQGFVADPFLAQQADQTWLLYEELDFARPKGILRAAPVNPAAPRIQWEQAVTIMEGPHHLSYPAVVRSQDGQWWMTPEIASCGETRLYRSPDFPRQWELAQVLFPDLPGIDPTLHENAQGWWLFVTHGARECRESNLFLFHATALQGPYKMVTNGPICTGLLGSRMAGHLVEHEGHHYRLGQDCRTGYGAAVAVFRIDVWTTTHYQESLVKMIEPDAASAFPNGMHTINVLPGLTVVDAMRNV